MRRSRCRHGGGRRPSSSQAKAAWAAQTMCRSSTPANDDVNPFCGQRRLPRCLAASPSARHAVATADMDLRVRQSPGQSRLASIAASAAARAPGPSPRNARTKASSNNPMIFDIRSCSRVARSIRSRRASIARCHLAAVHVERDQALRGTDWNRSGSPSASASSIPSRATGCRLDEFPRCERAVGLPAENLTEQPYRRLFRASAVASVKYGRAES